MLFKMHVQGMYINVHVHVRSVLLCINSQFVQLHAYIHYVCHWLVLIFSVSPYITTA